MISAKILNLFCLVVLFVAWSDFGRDCGSELGRSAKQPDCLKCCNTHCGQNGVIISGRNSLICSCTRNPITRDSHNIDLPYAPDTCYGCFGNGDLAHDDCIQHCESIDKKASCQDNKCVCSAKSNEIHTPTSADGYKCVLVKDAL